MEFNATFLVSAISFIVFVLLMNKIFYAPLEKIIGEREKLVADTLNEAKKSKEEITHLLDSRESKLNKASEDSKNIINTKVTKSNEESKKLTQQARVDADNNVNKLKSELEEYSKLAKKELQNASQEIAEQITNKIFG